MDITGRLNGILPEQGGQGNTGKAWRKQSFVIETTNAQYPKKVCFDVWGDKVDQIAALKGKEVIVNFDIESREFNGKWYTNAKAWKFQEVESSEPPLPPVSSAPTDDLGF